MGLFFYILIIYSHRLTSTLPKIIPAPIVPIPAKKNGIDTCNKMVDHFSCFMPGLLRAIFSSALFEASWPPPLPPPLPAPGSGSEDAMDVVMIELNEPVVECGKPDNLSLSVSENNERKKRKRFLKNVKI